MDSSTGEYFGSETQKGLQERAENLWAIVRDDPRFCCHGRTVGLCDFAEDNLAAHVALARLQGATSMDGLSVEIAERRKADLLEAGLVTDEYACWTGEAETFDAAADVVERFPLAADLTVIEIGPETSADDVRALDQLTQGCDVLLPMGSFLRGRQRPSTFLCAMDGERRAVGASGAVAQFHPDHAKGNRFWWGMLATNTTRRGEGIAIRLGAMALLRMREKFGMSRCFTGIRDGNGPSEALCSKLGLTPDGTRVVIAIDPRAFSGGQVTK